MVTSQPTTPFSTKHWRGPLQVRNWRSWPLTQERARAPLTKSHCEALPAQPSPSVWVELSHLLPMQPSGPLQATVRVLPLSQTVRSVPWHVGAVPAVQVADAPLEEQAVSSKTSDRIARFICRSRSIGCPAPMRPCLFVLFAFATTGCIDRMILDGTIKSTRDASGAFDTLSDLEVAKIAAGSSLVQIEGMQQLAPDNEDAMFLLLQAWTGFGGAFIEDEWEQAYDGGDEEAEAAQGKRANEAYDRAIRFGTMLLEQRKPGFVAAQKNYDTVVKYLAGHDDAEALLWLGAAWLSRGSVAAEKPEVVAELYVGVALMERSVAVNPRLAYGLGYATLGAYHARSPDAELADAKDFFEKSLAVSGRKALTTQLLYAQNWACQARDETAYRALLQEILDAGDVLPAQRLENTIAVRKAKRYLQAPRLKRCGFGGAP